MTVAKVSQKQKETLELLLQFRFLNTFHIQKILHHKNPTYIRTILKDLLDKKYVRRQYSRKTYNDSSTPAVYYLAPLSKHALKTNEDWNEKILERTYKEKGRSETFIDHCLTIVDIYLFFKSMLGKGDKLYFMTKTELSSFDYFPEELPDAYIAIESKGKTKRYFLDLFDPYTPPRFIRRRFRTYLDYAGEGAWQEETGDNVIPSLLFVLPNLNTQKHIEYYVKSKLEQAFDDTISLFLTTKDAIQNAKDGSDIWEEVK